MASIFSQAKGWSPTRVQDSRSFSAYYSVCLTCFLPTPSHPILSLLFPSHPSFSQYKCHFFQESCLLDCTRATSHLKPQSVTISYSMPHLVEGRFQKRRPHVRLSQCLTVLDAVVCIQWVLNKQLMGVQVKDEYIECYYIINRHTLNCKFNPLREIILKRIKIRGRSNLKWMFGKLDLSCMMYFCQSCSWLWIPNLLPSFKLNSIP